MLFNSYIFIFIFLPTVYFIFRLSSRFNTNVSLVIPIISSFIFYSYWNIYNICIILSSLVLNIIIGTSFIKSSFNYIRKIVLHYVFCLIYALYLLIFRNSTKNLFSLSNSDNELCRMLTLIILFLIYLS